MAFWVILEGMILSTLEPHRKQSNVRNVFLGKLRMIACERQLGCVLFCHA